jgi:hypothetical protein
MKRKEVALRYIVYKDSSKTSPLEECEVTMTLDGENETQTTNLLGEIYWEIFPNCEYHFWCRKSGYIFANPDIQNIEVEYSSEDNSPAKELWENYKKNSPNKTELSLTKNPCLDIEYSPDIYRCRTNCAVSEDG